MKATVLPTVTASNLRRLQEYANLAREKVAGALGIVDPSFLSPIEVTLDESEGNDRPLSVEPKLQYGSVYRRTIFGLEPEVLKLLLPKDAIEKIAAELITTGLVASDEVALGLTVAERTISIFVHEGLHDQPQETRDDLYKRALADFVTQLGGEGILGQSRFEKAVGGFEGGRTFCAGHPPSRKEGK